MDTGIYIHIPFCLSKCYYCDFPSYVKGQDVYEAYVDALIQEIKAYKTNLYSPLTIKTIFIGGGTPSVLPPILLARVMKTIAESFNIAKGVEYTVESNPGTLSLDKLNVMKEYGVNRISMGAQAFQDHLLKKIGRVHTKSDLINTYYLCRSNGFDNINLDLMFALPGQTFKDWKETLEKVTNLGPDHISAYSLIVEDETPFGELYEKGSLELLDEDIERRMYHYAKDYLAQKGYDQYEISNFAKPSKASRHNIDCWKCKSYIGLGLGSHSYFNGYRYNNTYNMDEYIKCSMNLDIIQKDKEFITLKAQMEEYMFLGLRLTKGIELKDFKKRFNKSLYEVYGSQVKKHKKQNLLIEKKDRIFLTDLGQDLSNLVFNSFL